MSHFDFKTFRFVGDDGNARAVDAPDGEFTWLELRDRSLLLADRLLGRGRGQLRPVIVYGHKQRDFLPLMAGCMTAGIPYVPIDTSAPMHRVEAVVAAFEDPLVVSLVPGVDRIGAVETLTVAALIAERPSGKALPAGSREDIVYIIFTSGSTGTPKGVQISREALQSFAAWLANDFGFGTGQGFVNHAPFSFDLSVYELVGALQSGGMLLLGDRDELADTGGFVRRMSAAHPSIWVSTPSSAQRYLMERSFDAAHLPDLRTFLFCGETLPKRVVTGLHERFPGCRVLNTYGPTEATVAISLVEITDAHLAYDSLPVGRVRDDVRVLFDGPEPQRGEMLIVGDCVSHGYFGRPDLTAERFFTHETKRGYRTGDEGWLLDGLLFFGGRQDLQIKANGFRIELGDINVNCEGINGVAACHTIAIRKDGVVKKLVSFVQRAAGASDLSREQLLAELAKRVPPYMLPKDLVFVESFPWSANAKVDLKALEKSYLAPIGQKPG